MLDDIARVVQRVDDRAASCVSSSTTRIDAPTMFSGASRLPARRRAGVSLPPLIGSST